MKLYWYHVTLRSGERADTIAGSPRTASKIIARALGINVRFIGNVTKGKLIANGRQ